MGLDVLTPLGQKTIADELGAVAIWERHMPGWKYSHTKKDADAVVDAVLLLDGTVEAVAETKCRYGVTEATLFGPWGGEWLITHSKVLRMCEVAKALRVPLYGFLYLVDERLLLTERIADSDGQIVVPMRTAETETRQTVNGGTATRVNAFIDMTNARRWRHE
jgi:hypothetical protein